MLNEAHQRIQNEPNRYVNHVFGEHENGGTSTFTISPVPFEQLGFPAVQTTESPAEFNRLATEIGTPVIASTVAVGMTGIYLMLNHKEHKKDGKHAEQAKPEPEGAEEK
jgi:formate dehydrogenase iron-sulfur subunit